jgi:hypothetical protein
VISCKSLSSPVRIYVEVEVGLEVSAWKHL